METEKVVPEVELTDESKRDVKQAVDAVVNETAQFFESLNNAVMTTAQDLTGLMILRVDKSTREHLDLLVDAGVAKNRRAAVHALIDAGMETQQDVFERVRRTKAQIAALRYELRTLVQSRSA